MTHIFKPNHETKNQSIPYSRIIDSTFYKGQTLNILHMQGDKTDTFVKFFTNYAEQKVYVEIETFLKSIDVKDDKGKVLFKKKHNLIFQEIILQVWTEIGNNKVFYTDSNGLEM